MIQLYKPSTSAAVLQGMTRNGDLILHPISCVQHLVLNGTWELTMKLPLDTPLEGTHLDVEVGSTIRAMGHNRSDQLFRVYQVTPSLTGVDVKAVPIFMQSAQDVFLNDVRPTNKTGQQALTAMISGAINSGSGYTYSASSDITDTNTAYYIRKNLIEAIQGENETSFLNRWGGEVYYDNFTIYVNQRQGSDRSFQVRYGYNMTGCKQKVDMSSVVTRVVPVAYNGRMLPAVYVDSPLINNYPFVRTKVIEYPDIKLTSDLMTGDEAESYDTEAELQTALQQAAELEFSQAGIDLPTISYDISLASLEGSEEYNGITDLGQVYLGDTVHIYNKKLNIETTARVVEIYYDCVQEKTQRVVLGDYDNDYFSRISKTIRIASQVIDDGTATVKAGKVAGILNAMYTQLRLQNDAATHSDVRAILFEELDSNSDLYGAMSLGTQGFQIANSRLADDSDWDWKTFGTAEGFSAEYIIAGVLASQNYDGTQGVYIDLNTGTIYAPSLQIGMAQVTGGTDLQTSVNALEDELTDMSAYFRTGYWGSNNEFGAAVVVGDNMVLVSGTAVSLIQNNQIDTPVAVLDQQKLVVTDGIFNDSVTIGKFKFIPRSNGNLSLVYTG